MALLVRGDLRTNRWVDAAGCVAENIPADALGDLRTKGNALSVYEMTEVVTAERIAIAVAAGKQNPDQTGYAIFDGNLLEALGVEVKKTSGNTADAAVNELHRDLQIGTAGKLVQLAGIIGNVQIVPILKKRVEYLLRAGFESGEMDASHNPSLFEKVRIMGRRT